MSEQISVPVPPLLAGLSEKKLRMHLNDRRLAQGFEYDPPACRTCTHFKPPQLVPVECRDGKTRMNWSASYCGLGHFACVQTSVCDMWRSSGGETLENHR